MNELTRKELRERKRVLEVGIYKLLVDFVHETDLSVIKVCITSERLADNSEQQVILSVQTVVEI
jgi:hypothetical protein